jgi:hydroxymethylbilane synthase
MIKIGTRGSKLALWQAGYISELLGKDITETIVIKTKGDKIQNVSFDKMEGKGFFTKEIEDALLDCRIDAAVHSMKDLPTENTPGLMIAAVTVREDPSDVLLVRNGRYNDKSLLPLFEGGIVGTSSLRRASQLRMLSKSIVIRPLRGNVTTRIKKLREGKFDAIVVARAGLNRLKIQTYDLIEYPLPYSFFLPAPAQGALAIQIRSGDSELFEQIKKLNHRDTEITVSAERFFLKHFGGGCHIPLGAFAFMEKGSIHLSGVIASVDGSRSIRKIVTGSDPEDVGMRLARQMKDEGADRLL